MRIRKSFASETLSSRRSSFKSFLQSRRYFISFLYVFTILLNLYLRANVPTRAAFLAPHDDQLGLELASNILNGDWLGPWDNRTLAKPPGYSMYLAVAHFIPLQLVVLNQLLYIFVVLFLVRKLQLITQLNLKYKSLIKLT